MTRRGKVPAGRWRAGLINIAVVVALLAAATFLPPDNSLRDVQSSGVLRVCVPSSNPPLVTGDPDAPGYDIEVLQLMASDLGLRLLLNVNSDIGRDFNPLNWRVTRANCAVIAGGVNDSPATRGFLQTLPTGISTGWMVLAPGGAVPEPGSTVAVAPASPGLDRLQLSRFLRTSDLRPLLAGTPDQMLAALRSGSAAAAIGDRFSIEALHAQLPEMAASWLPNPPFDRYRLVFGLWKGDLTLLRALRRSVDRLAADGTLAALAEKYGVAEPEL